MWNVILFVILLVLQLVLYLSTRKLSFLSQIGNTFQAVALLLAAIQFTRAALKAVKQEIPFRNLMAFGMWVWLMGHGLLAYSELLLKKEATGTATDAIWLIGYGLIFRALYIKAGQYAQKQNLFRLTAILIVIITVLIFATLWPIVLDPERTLLNKFIQVIFPYMDFLIAGMAFFVAKKSADRRWLLGAGGSALIGVCDLIFPFYEAITSHVYRNLDIPLFIGYSMWWLLGAWLAREQAFMKVEVPG